MSGGVLRFDAVKFGTVLKRRRGKHTLREFGVLVGVDASTLSRLENGKHPTVDTLAQLCDVLGLHMGSYFGRVDADDIDAPIPFDEVD